MEISARFEVSVVIPVYFAEATIAPLVERLVEVFPSDSSLQIVLVNDGSKDRTHEACRLLCERFPGVVQYLRLAKNFGEHSAVKVVSLRVRTVRPGLPLPLGPRPADTMSRGFDVTVLQRTVSFPP
jgi:cellulose synthase/poly-beta-1,6-N-acetylglucosamine synthase-like glycosyltransferase